MVVELERHAGSPFTAVCCVRLSVSVRAWPSPGRWRAGQGAAPTPALAIVRRVEGLALLRGGVVLGPTDGKLVLAARRVHTLHSWKTTRRRKKMGHRAHIACGTLTIQLTPNRSATMPKLGEKKVLVSGIWTLPPS